MYSYLPDCYVKEENKGGEGEGEDKSDQLYKQNSGDHFAPLTVI